MLFHTYSCAVWVMGSFLQLSKIWLCIFQINSNMEVCSPTSYTPNPKDTSPARLHCRKHLRNDCTIWDTPRDQHPIKTGLFLEVSPSLLSLDRLDTQLFSNLIWHKRALRARRRPEMQRGRLSLSHQKVQMKHTIQHLLEGTEKQAFVDKATCFLKRGIFIPCKGNQKTTNTLLKSWKLQMCNRWVTTNKKRRHICLSSILWLWGQQLWAKVREIPWPDGLNCIKNTANIVLS